MMANYGLIMEYYSTKTDLLNEKTNLVLDKMKLDRFFSLFLDKYGMKMDSDKTNTPIWDLYKKKLKEYTELDVKIKTLDYRLSKF